jgi:hypothetical protein
MRRKPLTCTFLCSTGGVVAASGTSGPADGFVAISITILVRCEGARLLHWTLIALKHYFLIHIRLEGPKNVSVQLPPTKFDGCFRTQEFEPMTRQLRVRQGFLFTRRGFAQCGP